MGGKKSQTVGYHYLFAILFGLCRGPINQLKTIRVGGKVAWDDALCDNGESAINEPDLFGGKKKEGGIQGPFWLSMGGAAQVLPGASIVNVSGVPQLGGDEEGPHSGSQILPDLKETIGGRISEFRGVVTLWFDGLVTSMNPYPKEWAFRVRRFDQGWYNDECWYPDKAAIFMGDGYIHAMNPAHIIYYLLTNPLTGRGLPAQYVNENSFLYAANTLCSEGFGLCLGWQRTEDVDAFIQIILDHIDAVLYPDPSTGQMTLKLVRADFVVADLPVFQPGSGLIEIEEDDNSSQDTMFSEIVGTGHDPRTDEDFQQRVHNLAARHSQDGPITENKQYPGIPTKDLLVRVLQRDLGKYARGLKKLKVTLDRAGYALRPGMPFILNDPRRDIDNIVVRVGQFEDASQSDGKITVRVLEDVFSTPETSFVAPSEGTWEPVPDEPVPAPVASLQEASYIDVYTTVDAPTLATLTDTDTFAGTVAQAPVPSIYHYDLASRVAGEPLFAVNVGGGFSGTATLVAAILPLDTAITLENIDSISSANVGQALLIDNEWMELISIDTGTGATVVKRGVGDTIPAEHALGARVWTIDEDLVGDSRMYASGEEVEAKVLTRTSSQRLDPVDADTLSLELVGRFGRPYPPGDVTIQGDPAFEVSGTLVDTPPFEPLLEWAHRDRILQADQLVGHVEASVGPEAGTTYTIRVYDYMDGDTLLRTEAGITDAFWTYTFAMQTTDGDPLVARVELESVRDGLTSWQKYSFLIPLSSGFTIDYEIVTIDDEPVEFE